jgi:hypothetical protein
MLLCTLLLAMTLGQEVLLRGLVADLGANDYRQRERATRLLRQLSPLGYHHLLRATTSPDPEVRRRARALVRQVQAEVLRQAAQRQVVLYDPRVKDRRCLGTVLVAGRSRAYVLTADLGTSSFGPTVTVEWGGKRYGGRIVQPAGTFELFVFPCWREVAPVRLADGTGRGCWWNGRLDLDARFEQDMELPVSGKSELGGGVFTLDEDRLEVMLAGVSCGTRTNMAKDWTPAAGHLRRWLKQAIPPEMWHEEWAVPRSPGKRLAPSRPDRFPGAQR